LTGLLVPVAIHLLSRKEGRVIYIGSLRHLEESNTSQFRALKLNEYGLLAIRCLLLVLVVLLLAGVQFSNSPSKQSWLLIEKSAEQQSEAIALIDSLEERGYEKHYWQEGFPLESDSGVQVNSWNLIQDLSRRGVTAVVITHSYLTQFKGERIVLPSTIQWITVGSKPRQIVVAAHPFKRDSLLLRISTTSEQQTSLEYRQVSTLSSDSVIVTPMDTLVIHIAYTEKYSREKELVAALVKSLQTIPSTVIQLSVRSDELPPDQDTDWLFWLSEKQLPPTSSNSIQIAAESNGGEIL
jgi:hypothetical protein